VSASEAAIGVSTGPGTLVALYRLFLRTQISVQRLLGIGALGAIAVLIGLFARSDANPAQAAADGVAGYGLGLLVPLAALWLGASAIGDLVEDRLLAYLWLKPVPRWQLPAAASLATVTIVLPLAVLPLVVSALVAGAGEVAWLTLLAATLAALAYAGLFAAAGLAFKRAVWLGLAFILLWENVAANAAAGTARFTVLGWAVSILDLASGVQVSPKAGSAALAFVVLPAIAVAAWLLATWRYRRMDID
jgi:ABC-type transport system involved in multi-copper enzyme maturation permease subunit